MESSINRGVGWDGDDIRVRLLDGPPPLVFDCGRAEQNDFLLERAWFDQQRWLSVTRLFFVKGIVAAYLTTTADAIELGTREKDPGVRYPSLGAIKLAQLGVDRRFSGSGLGRFLVGYVIEYARLIGGLIGCRYVTLDAQPDLVGWYTSQGFVRNHLVQNRKVERARAAGRDEALVPVSMRFDLLADVEKRG